MFPATFTRRRRNITRRLCWQSHGALSLLSSWTGSLVRSSGLFAQEGSGHRNNVASLSVSQCFARSSQPTRALTVRLRGILSGSRSLSRLSFPRAFLLAVASLHHPGAWNRLLWRAAGDGWRGAPAGPPPTPALKTVLTTDSTTFVMAPVHELVFALVLIVICRGKTCLHLD